MMKLWEARVLAKRVGATIVPRPDVEFRVNLTGGTEDQAYYTTDLVDAVASAYAMADEALVREYGRVA